MLASRPAKFDILSSALVQLKTSFPRTYRRQLALQAAPLHFRSAPARLAYFSIRGEPLPWREVSIAIGGVALIFSWAGKQAWWWRAIHTVFVPMLWAVSLLNIDPAWFLAAFILTLLGAARRP